MKLTAKHGIPWIIVSAVMVTILGLLGWLQYRWSTQISEAYEAQLGASLQSLMMDWHTEFFRNFAGICISLQVGPDAGAHDGWQDYAQRYQEWRQTDSDPGLVRSVSIWETSQPVAPRLARLDAHAVTTEADISPDLMPLLQHLQANSSSLAQALRAWLSATEAAHVSGTKSPSDQPQRTDPLTGWQFDPGLPALVHPIIHHPISGDEVRSKPGAVDWIVVLLDFDTIRERLLPRLSERHFGGSDNSEYEVAVVSGGDHQAVIYASDPAFKLNPAVNPDASMTIFGPPPWSVEGHLWQTIKNGIASRNAQRWRKFPAPVWFPIIRQDSNDTGWKLLMIHRNGSLEQIASGIQRRNLETGFGILLLLALAMAMVMVATQRAQRLAKLQMDFVASVSHELRTPLSVISSASDNLVDGIVRGEQQLQQYGSVIRDQSRQLTALVEQILLFAATRDGQYHYQLSILKVPEILGRALGNIAGLVQQSGFVLEESVQPDLPMVRGDLGAISTVLQNLIINAIKYSGDSRWVAVRAAVVETGNRQHEVQITVQDRGIGISDEEVQHIFEPFYRSPSVAAAQIHGTGLGLPLAKRIAEDMGGRLSIVSRPGAGSSFTLHLPCVEQTDTDLSILKNSPAAIGHTKRT
ncbi:MAG TPA: HAMP domain-containing sensor histidine kinase [Terriglobales bacterium]|nr:HAMP domain-containing sensor histidine kinase [Terriglobales bacterium]